MEDHPDMKKSSVWTILVPAIFCALVLICMFIWRQTAIHRIQLEHPSISNSDSTDTDEQTDTKPPKTPNERIDINTADWKALAKLPGIGEVLAKRIVEFRNKYGPFASVEDLLSVTGIGEKKLNNIISYITVGGQK